MEIGLAARSCVLRQSKNRLLQAIFPLSQGQFWIVASPFLQCRKALQNCRKSHFRPFLGERLHRLWYVPQFETEVKKTQLVFPKKRAFFAWIDILIPTNPDPEIDRRSYGTGRRSAGRVASVCDVFESGKDRGIFSDTSRGEEVDLQKWFEAKKILVIVVLLSCRTALQRERPFF